ncbi:hypothetical protein M758_2G064100 [Ceratodon purpureus]|nr:hypothetical protein M758_2G064100 [Ceratodon purpureus]
MCVRAFAHVSAARGWHLPLLSSSLWGRQALGSTRVVFKLDSCVAARRWTGPSFHRHVTIVATATKSQESNPSQTIFFSDAGLNRAAEMRVDKTKLSDAFESPEALVVPLMEVKNLVKEGKPVLVPASALKLNDADHACAGYPVFLGLSNSTKAPVFAVNLEKQPSSAGGERPAWEDGGEWVDVRRYGPQLQASDAGLLAYARGMVEWQSRNKYCGSCGQPMVAKDGGHSLHCSSDSCKTSAYPRLDPAVIMLVACGNYVLLGRQSRWNPGRYSLLAGFVEIGETFEMAVAREVKEESGIDIDRTSVSYTASQPWPFPSSLMVGFSASAMKNPSEPYRTDSENDNAIAVSPDKLSIVDEVRALPQTSADKIELEDARWVHKDLLRWILKGNTLPHGIEFSIPGSYAIANILLSRWAESGSDSLWAGDDVKSVEIDEGVFKYVLMCISDDEGREKLIVRGNGKLAYHSDILKATEEEVKDVGLQVSQLGGGRIDHNAKERKLHVFSSSQGFGLANHTITCAILRQWYPLHSITLAWGG